ncbi:MAG TPA: glycosyltransferase family 2 protein [Thermoplasmata archaeon]|nr:glycosyltransferase family 2 protein [Thermoplasmata archaeon]
MRASLVIPTLNESASIGHVLRTFRTASESANQRFFFRNPIEWELLVVDGPSTDGTAEVARREGARVISETREGYGRAYRTGFAAATGEIIATADGDASYPVEEIPWFVLDLLEHRLDFLTCDRLSYLDTKAMTTEHRIGNWVLNFALRAFFHSALQGAPARVVRDSQSGMWIFRREILDRVRLTQDGMAFSEELKIEVLLRGLRFEETPIHYAERWGAPKLSSWRDGARNMLFLFQKRFQVSLEERRGSERSPLDRPESMPR